VSPGAGPVPQADQISFGPVSQDEISRPGGTVQGAAGPGLAIATSGLTKRFRKQLAVAGIDLAVPRGSVYGFLGPNGSGKTTTIRMLLGLIQPTSGSHELLGVAMPGGINAVLPKVGSLVEGPAFYPQLSGRANLARLDAVDRTASRRTAAARIDHALKRVGLLGAAGKRYRAYSLGMKQRLAIAAGLLQPRELMILDEPTNGLDPQGTREVRALIREIAADGTTIFVSSHLLAEVEQICSHVGVMRAGKLVFEGTLAQLRGGGAARIVILTPEPAAAAKVLAGLGLADVRGTEARGTDVRGTDVRGTDVRGTDVRGTDVRGTDVRGTDVRDTAVEVSAELGGQRPDKICADLVHAGVPVAGLATPQASLEERFVELTGEGFDVNG
jgi:ABC-2 type transport system ATP-binding protein